MFNPTEEFHQLNSHLQIYLDHIKQIDEHNRQLQQTIDHLRRDFLRTLQEHFTRLPDDFRNESDVLTQAHLQRYEWKSRARRFLAEREELKKRIYFLVHSEKEQTKRRIALERNDRQLENDCEIIQEQLRHVYQYVQREKQIQQQSMDHLDQLRIQLEQISIERSKREFQIQSLREEVKLMQTSKEFLDEEYQTILSTQTNASEYYLSRLNQSIERIREDFSQLNQTQLKQMEEEYEQWMNHQSSQEITQSEEEYRSMMEELTTLKKENDFLSETISTMEIDLTAIRLERIQELIEKENEFERNEIELRRLNEQLNYFAEYDRNLKFELTLYRGVLQSEDRRKEQAMDQMKNFTTLNNRNEKKASKNSIDQHERTESNTSIPIVSEEQESETTTVQPSSESSISFVNEDESQTHPIVMNIPPSSSDILEDFSQNENVGKESLLTLTKDIDPLSDENEQEIRIDVISSTDDDCFQANFEGVMQDLRYVYCSLLNADSLLEINDDFSNQLIERLEFDDHLIRTLFNNLLQTYIVEPIKTENRSNTLDWEDFRDILFPILTGRYTEGHLRKLFDLFDLNQTGYLFSKELAELLDLIQVKEAKQSAEDMINGKENLNIEEFLEMIKRNDGLNKNLLSEQIELQPWYIQHPIIQEIPTDPSTIIPCPSPTKISNEIILLSRIFRRIGADFENRQLDCTKPSLSMRLTNELIHNNIHISNHDLQLFIELYFKQKQISDSLINWVEFRDVFWPLVNGGMISDDDLTRWFDIIDLDQKKSISTEQLLHLLRLLQIPNPEDIHHQMRELFPENDQFWTLPDLIFALKNLDQIPTHWLDSDVHINLFDLQWLRKNLF